MSLTTPAIMYWMATAPALLLYFSWLFYRIYICKPTFVPWGRSPKARKQKRNMEKEQAKVLLLSMSFPLAVWAWLFCVLCFDFMSWGEKGFAIGATIVIASMLTLGYADLICSNVTSCGGPGTRQHNDQDGGTEACKICHDKEQCEIYERTKTDKRRLREKYPDFPFREGAKL